MTRYEVIDHSGAVAIAALEDDIARLQTAHVQMQRAMDDLAAELADLQHDMGRAQVALSAMATDNERLRDAIGYLVGDMVAADMDDFASIAIARAALTAPTSGC